MSKEKKYLARYKCESCSYPCFLCIVTGDLGNSQYFKRCPTAGEAEFKLVSVTEVPGE